jgi:carboxylesterase type B
MKIAAVLMQLHSKEPLFKRCISMSGTPIMLKPLPLVAAEASYAKIMKELGLEDASVEERIEKLKIVTPDEQVEKTPMTVPLTPYLDGDIIPGMATFANLASTDDTLETSVPGHQWCEGLMIGDCQHDGNVFIFMGLAERKAGIAAALSTSLHANIPPIAAKATLNAYCITPATADDEAMAAIIDLGTNIAYHAPALAYARSFSGRTYQYHFNEPNPWEGPFKGCSTHMLDAAFLFQNFNELLPPEAQVVAKRFAADFLRFANGEQPWQNFERNAGKVKVYGPSNERVSDVVKGNGWGSGRRDTLFKLSEAGKIDLDELSGAWDLFIAGK